MIIRPAVLADLLQIVTIYNLDALTGNHEEILDPLPAYYYEAFAQIESSADQALYVAERDGLVWGTVQVSCIQHLIHRALRRAIVEAVFIHPSHQGKGVGGHLMQRAIRFAADKGCHSIELTSNKARTRAHAFYERLGFEATHEGFKRDIVSSDLAENSLK
jgi:GNAT superfamily N-acetyltransferase